MPDTVALSILYFRAKALTSAPLSNFIIISYFLSCDYWTLYLSGLYCCYFKASFCSGLVDVSINVRSNYKGFTVVFYISNILLFLEGTLHHLRSKKGNTVSFIRHNWWSPIQMHMLALTATAILETLAHYHREDRVLLLQLLEGHHKYVFLFNYFYIFCILLRHLGCSSVCCSSCNESTKIPFGFIRRQFSSKCEKRTQIRKS